MDRLPDYLIAAQHNADEAEEKFTDLNGRAKKAKIAWEAAQAEVAKLIRDSESDQPELPFGESSDGGDDDQDGQEDAQDATGSTDDAVDAEFTPLALEGPSGSILEPSESPGMVETVVRMENRYKTVIDVDAWKVAPTSDLLKLGLAPGIVAKLDEMGLSTIGGIADWTNSGKLLTDVDGIGEAKAQEIEDVLETFWADWQHRQAASPAQPAKNKKAKRAS